jgi:uncharacterized membrane protein YgcG
MSEFAGRDSAPDAFSAEDLLDPCCAKEAVNQRRRAAYYNKLRAIDPTRVALASRRAVVSMAGRGVVACRPRAHRQTCDYIHGGTTVAACACEAEGAGGYASDSSADLDDLLDGFGAEEEGWREGGGGGGGDGGRHGNDGDRSSDGDGDGDSDGDTEYQRLLKNRRRDLKQAAASAAEADAVASAANASSSSSSSTTNASARARTRKMRRISSDRVEMEIVRSPRLVVMVVGQGSRHHRSSSSSSMIEEDDDVSSSSSAEEQAVAGHLRTLAVMHAATTAFRLVVDPRAQDMRLLGIDRVPAIVACIDGRVVARATRLERFRGSAADTGMVEVAQRLEPWLEHSRVSGHGDGGGRRRRGDGSGGGGGGGGGGGDASSEEDDIFEDAALPSCGKAGCTKGFHHVHIGLPGIGIDAQLLSVTD